MAGVVYKISVLIGWIGVDLVDHRHGDFIDKDSSILNGASIMTSLAKRKGCIALPGLAQTVSNPPIFRIIIYFVV